MRPDTSDYRAIFLQGLPLLDTRAPVEFARGAFPGALNLPLMSDREREQVGICYKREGQQAAIALGHRLVAGETRENRLARWCAFARQHPGGYLYCFRGGLRSQTVQQWMREAGVEYPLVRGGYKAMRRFLMEQLDAAARCARTALVAGRTGVGKTRVVHAVSRSIDLEGLANHRGSSFGRLISPQPSQVDFENALSVALLRLLDGSGSPLVMEDEGKLIGRLSLPLSLREHMREAPLLVVEESLDARVQTICEDYVQDLGRRYGEVAGSEGPAQHRRHLLEGLLRIRKRLGGALHSELERQLNAAFDAAGPSAAALHRDWIRGLLERYYDPMYDYQISQRRGAVMFSGPRDAVIEFANDWVAGG